MTSYKKFCISFVILTAFLLLVVHPAMFFASLGVEDAPARAIDNWFRVKEAHARNSTGRTLFALNGSGTLFGFGAAQMERELGITVVNFGTTASMQEYMFTRIRRTLKSGDIVLMPLDYGLYADHPLEEGNFVYVLEYDKEYFEKLPLADKVKYVYGVSFSFLVRRFIARAFSSKYGDDASDLLSSEHLNVNGDLTNNTYETRTYIKPLSTAKQNFSSSNFPGPWMKQIVSNFVEYCQRLHISVYATWPPLYSLTGKKEFYGYDAEVIEAIKLFWKDLNVPLLGDYRDAFVEADECYKDHIHINDRGRSRYTKHLIELIRPYI